MIVSNKSPLPYYCYRCEHLGITGSRWTWDEAAHNWICSNVQSHSGLSLVRSQGKQDAQGKQEPLQVYNGVLTDSGLVMIAQGKPARVALAAPVMNLGDILQLCLDHKLRAIWVLAGSALSSRATVDFVEAARPSWELRGVSYTSGAGAHVPMCKFASGYKPDEKTCYVGFAAHNDGWNMEDVVSPLVLLAALTYQEDALAAPALFSPGNAGRKLMERKNTKVREAWVRPVPELHTIAPIVDTGVNDCTWKRPLNEQERAPGSYIQAFDKNAMYPASCTSALLGEGMPTWVAMPHFDMKHLRPGVYKCTITGESPFNGVTLPHPTDGLTSGWFWTYTVKLLLELGYTVAIDEAWVWEHEQAHTTLRPWAESMYAARRSLKENTTRYTNAQARALAYDNIKGVANNAIGLLAHVPANPDWKGAYDWFRPDWNRLIKDNARYWMFRRMMKYAALAFSPVAIHADCLYYALPTNDLHAIPEMLDRAGSLGGFKVKYARLGAVPVTQEVATWFDELDITEINSRLLGLNRRAQEAQGEQEGR
jgi:hypothetical protein